MVSELELELDGVLDESHDLLVNLSDARSLQRRTLHSSSSPSGAYAVSAFASEASHHLSSCPASRVATMMQI